MPTVADENVSVRLSGRFETAARFARFCMENGLSPRDGAELCALGARAFSAGVRESNTGTSADGARRRFEDCAREAGFLVSWPGLWPLLHKTGTAETLFAVDLPEL